MAACDERRQDALTFLRLDDEIVVDGRPLRSGALYLQPFIRALARSGVARLTLARDLDLEECRALVDALAAGRRPESTSHVVVGQVEIVSPGGAPPSPSELRPRAAGRGGMSEAHVELARDAVRAHPARGRDDASIPSRSWSGASRMRWRGRPRPSCPRCP